MRYDEPDILESEEDWGRRRDNMRHEISLPAVITDRLGTRITCVIEDISATGMALNLGAFTPEPGREPLQQGTLATLDFAPDPELAPDERVVVEVRVMWRAPVAVGVRFTSSPPALRSALKAMAEAAVIARLDETEKRRRELSPAQRRVLQACRKTVQKLLPNLVWVARTELCNRLRLHARDAAAGEAREAAAEADLLESKAMGITRTIELQVLQGFSEASDLEETQELTLMQLQSTYGGGRGAQGSVLDMISEGESDRSARIAALAHSVEERYKSPVFELNVRLANVLG
ncbi:MAG: PilZ domain-containing protein, partial [Gammaproteobacteria bacterium]